jgi:hypothetical protein
MSPVRALFSMACAGALVAVFGCTAQTEPNRGACNGHSFASGAAHSVTCPGTATCFCGAPSVCCLPKIDSNQGQCTDDAQTCGGVTVTCDGAEDCAGGVCCLAGSFASCTPGAACNGIWLCRTDSDCNGSPNGGHCHAADYGISGVNDRGLDGLIGLCGSP